jgi:enoyl-CoA hydratase/carnithine racemase
MVEWHKEPEKAPRVAIVSGAGGKAFCAGGDVVALWKGGVGKLPRSILSDFLGREFMLDYTLAKMHTC